MNFIHICRSQWINETSNKSVMGPQVIQLTTIKLFRRKRRIKKKQRERILELSRNFPTTLRDSNLIIKEYTSPIVIWLTTKRLIKRNRQELIQRYTQGKKRFVGWIISQINYSYRNMTHAISLTTIFKSQKISKLNISTWWKNNSTVSYSYIQLSIRRKQ